MSAALTPFLQGPNPHELRSYGPNAATAETAGDRTRTPHQKKRKTETPDKMEQTDDHRSKTALLGGAAESAT